MYLAPFFSIQIHILTAEIFWNCRHFKQSPSSDKTLYSDKGLQRILFNFI